MKIIIPIITFGKSGGHRVLSQLANYWVAMGHEVAFVINHNYYSLPYFPHIAKNIIIDNNGNTISNEIEINNNDNISVKDKIYTMYSLYKFLNNKISSVDIILANHSFTAIPTYLSKLKNITKWYYIQAYEPDFYEDKNISSYILKKLSKITYSFPIKRIVNSPLYYNYKEINSNYFIPPGIDLNVFYAKKNEGISNTRPIKIGCIGRKEPIKGTAHVIQAFEQLLSEKMNVILYIAYGYVPIDADNEKIITVMPKNDKELSDFYRSVDIFITTPIFQHGAYHYPVMEAMACGTPVIHTGYLPGDINNSWIVQPGDTTDIVCKLKEIIVSANNQQISEKVNQGVKDIQSFSWDVVSNSMADIFLAQKR